MPSSIIRSETRSGLWFEERFMMVALDLLPACYTVATACILIFSAWLAYFIAKFLRIYFLISKFDGPPALPLFGNSYCFKKDPREMALCVEKNREKYRKSTGGLIRMWYGPVPAIIIYSAKHCEVLMNSSRHINKGTLYKFLEPWLGKGLLTSTGDKWHHRRKLLTPAFHFSILQNFMDVFNEQSAILVKKFEEIADTAEPINVFPLITHCTLDIICETAMGKRTNAQGDDENEYVKAVKRLSNIIVLRMRNTLWWPNIIFENLQAGKEQRKALEILHGVTRKMIRERLNEQPKGLNGSEHNGVAAGHRKRIAFLDLLLQMHREDASITLEEIREEVDTFMFEGHDTTAVATSSALLLLGYHPKIQARLHDELDQVFGTSDRPVTTDDLSKLQYVSCVAKETLRLVPSVPGITRKLEEDTILDGKAIPKEAIIVVHIRGIHHDPEEFPDPERFDPDRFLPENSTKRHPFAFIPFSAGPRNCIGQKLAMMEDNVLLINILRRFRIESLQTIDEARPVESLVARPADGAIMVKLISRK